MSDDRSRPYAIHSNTECDRLERQATLAGLPEHLSFVPVPLGARILDAGCGSGSMARLLASAHPDANVVGVDLRPEYVTYARERAAQDGLANVQFRQGDIFKLPFANGEFDVVWSKYVLQWVKDAGAAVSEFCRVTKKGGLVVCANFDGFAVTHWPEEATLQPIVNRVFESLADPFIGRKMASMFREAGLSAITVDFEPDRLFTTVGAIDPERRRNWVEQLTAAKPYIVQILGGEPQADEFTRAYLAYLDRSDTCTYTSLFFVRGRAPAA